jgi:DNA-binding transcriptional ArsR family regulator
LVGDRKAKVWSVIARRHQYAIWCEEAYVERSQPQLAAVVVDHSRGQPIRNSPRSVSLQLFVRLNAADGREHLPTVVTGTDLDRPFVCIRRRVWCILNRMVQYSRGRLDASFSALSDVTRRGVLEQLGRADASITDLADKFHMTLTGMKKHVGVLEQAGLVTTEKVGRVRTCKLGLRRLDEEAAWIERYRQLWDARFDELDKVVEELKRKEKVDGRKKRE